MPLAEGSKLGPYEIISLTGAGGMGEVYKAKDTRLDRIVAIKVLPSHLTASEEIKQRFEREAKTISSLNHPNICILYDIGDQDGTAYLVMEYLEGRTLAERIAEGPLTNDELTKYSIQIVDALDKAHKQGLIHRDLKPANVMLTKEGAKLLDFGLAKLQIPTGGFEDISGVTKTSTPLTQQGTIIGTIQYMSPEQLEGMEADARSDIFAFGGMLFEMVTGEKAFHGKSQASLIASVLKEEPKAVSQIQPLAPPMFERIIKQCLAKEPDDRWQTAGDLKHAIEWIADGGSQVGIPKTVSRNRKLRERVGISLTVLLLFATVFLSYFYYEKINEPVRVVKSNVMLPDGHLIPEFDGGSFVLSPDGSKIVMAVRDTVDGTPSLWIRYLNSLESIEVQGTNGASFPFWSPDGNYLGYFANGKLKKVLSTGGPSLAISDAPSGRGGSWNSDDIIIFTPTLTDIIYKVSAAGGTPEPITVRDTSYNEYTHRWAHFLPDNDHFLFFNRESSDGGGENDAICVSSLSEQKVKRLFRAKSTAWYSHGYIIYVYESILMAQPFDADKLELAGNSFPVVEGVYYLKDWSRAVFSLSRAGDLIYATGAYLGGSQLLIIDRSGEIIDTVGKMTRQGAGSISPDQSKIVVSIADQSSGNTDIWIHAIDRGLESRFTFEPTLDIEPIWSPDGNEIVYRSDSGGSYFLYKKHSSGLRERELLYEDSLIINPRDWSSDGKYIIMEKIAKKTVNDIWILPVGSPQTAYPYLSKMTGEYDAIFSPDGKWIAYDSDESGMDQIYVTSFPNPSGKWQVSINGGGWPKWSADGKGLFFLSNDDDIMEAEVDGSGNSFKVGATKKLFHVNASRTSSIFRPFKDGQRFLVNARSSGNEVNSVILVRNWQEELKK